MNSKVKYLSVCFILTEEVEMSTDWMVIQHENSAFHHLVDGTLYVPLSMRHVQSYDSH